MSSEPYDPIRHITRSAAAKRVRRTTRTLKMWEASKGLTPIRINSRLFVYDRQQFEFVAQDVIPATPEFLRIRR